MQTFPIVITLSLLLLSFTVFSQTDSLKARIDPKSITTQGQQEQYWAQEIFDRKYSAEHFERYKGIIVPINKNTFTYDGIVITAGYTGEDYRLIFDKGIFYPAIFSGYNDGRILEIQRGPDLLLRNDSLGISIVEEFKFLNPSAKIKRYKLYLWRLGFANPTMYVFELINEKATDTTDLKTFLNAARLSFLKFVSILI